MPWQLEIHHLDVGQGDSTLFVARRPAGGGAAAVVRSVLVDGGREIAAADNHVYLTTAANLGVGGALNVIVVTHYDADHCNGIKALLNLNTNFYNNCLLFDQGWPDGTGDDPYLRYLAAINRRGARTRVTGRVRSYGNPTPPLAPAQGTAARPGAINQHPAWLVGREIMWTDAAGAPNAALYGGGAAPGAAGGPPSIRCIAANEYVQQVAGGSVQIASGLNDEDGKNARSLCFLVVLEGFRYYIGGDVLSMQEDDAALGIGRLLQAQGQTHAMKTSHHGSGASSSAAFMARLNPRAAFISCGYNNNFGQNPAIGLAGPWPDGHPQQRVLQDLEARGNLAAYYLTKDRGDDDYCRRLNRGNGPWQQAYTAKARIAGCWGPPDANAAPGGACGGSWPNDSADVPREGHIILRVAAATAPAFTVSYVRPRISMPLLNAPLTLPAGVGWPAGQILPVGTQLPAGSIWPAGAVPVQGMGVLAAYVLPVALPWPPGGLLWHGLIYPGALPLPVGGFWLPLATQLPAGVYWANGQYLPANTILPAGTVIPPGTVVPTPSLAPGTLLVNPTVLPPNVCWPNGQPLPAATQLPAGTTFPVGSSWPAGTPLPAGLPHNCIALPAGATLLAGFLFPPGTTWPAGVPLPALQLTTPLAGMLAAYGLPTNTVLPTGATLPPGIHWPANTAVPHPIGQAPAVVQVDQY